MNILITGAKGNFPSALIPKLADDGHELVLLDLEPMEPGEHRIVQADVRDAGAVTEAMTGCDAVVHAMAYHGNMASRRNDDDYWAVNVTGTHNVLLAMKRLGVAHLVFSSSEVVYGLGLAGRRVVDESVPCIPNHYYALTKVLGEQMCEYHARMHGMRVAMLRYGVFVAYDWKLAGVGRLTAWLDREDVAEANRLALNALTDAKFSCEAFVINNARPWVDADWPALVERPETVVERYWPGSVDLLSSHGLEVPNVPMRYDISKARTMLGYEPEHTFDVFLERLRSEPPTAKT